MFVFLCQTPRNQLLAINEADSVRRNGGMISVLAYGDLYEENSVRILASSPDYYLAVNETTMDSFEVSQWMIQTALPDASTIPTPSVTETTTTVDFGNETTTVQFNETTTVDFNETTTVDFNETTTGDMNATTPLPNPTVPTTTVPTYCAYQDVVFVIERSCFDTQEKFDSYVQPIITDYIDRIDQCVKLAVAVVEYGTWADATHSFEETNPQQARAMMKDYELKYDFGTDSYTHEAFKIVNYQVGTNSIAI